VRVAEGVEMLEITSDIMGRQSTICPTLLWDEQDVVLVDAGFPGQLPLLREAMARAGVPFGRLTKVLITHHDFDHIGSLPDVVAETGGRVEVIAHAGEKPYVQGERIPAKLTPEAVARSLASLPPDLAAQRRQAIADRLANPPKARVDRTFGDGEELALCGGIVAIATPGHTPAHTSFYHKPSRTLIAGDALTAADGRLNGPSEGATLDVPLARRSLRNFAPYDVAAVIAYHGGLVRGGGIRERIAELAG
jgi:glyoxylase-like metal-dependent hydrolase (beta-lactamase superfamily II)